MAIDSTKRVIHRFIREISAYEFGGELYSQIIPLDTQAYAIYPNEDGNRFFYVIGDGEHTYTEIRDGKGLGEAYKEYPVFTKKNLNVIVESVEEEARERKAADEILRLLIEEEKQIREDNDAILQQQIDDNEESISTLSTRLNEEIVERKSDVERLDTAINKEQTARTEGDEDLTSRLNEEIKERKQFDNLLDEAISEEILNRQSSIENLSNELNVEIDKKLNKVDDINVVYGTDAQGEQILYAVNSFGQVDDVRVGNDSVVVNKIATLGTMAGENASDYSTKAVADTLYADKTQTEAALAGKQNSLTEPQMEAVNSGITNDLVGQITTNQSNIESIEEKIPAQASAQNQLTDRNFVNSSIATNTANFIGTFDSLAELEAYSGPVTNNDYAFVINTDESGNVVYDRYKYTVVTDPASWEYEFSLNNSSFTSNQWAAINSGITSTKVSNYDAHIGDNTIHVTASDKQTWNAKQNALTAGSNIQINGDVISATDTTYTAGTGIDITNGIISNTQTSAEWGNITGTLSDQTDLQTALDDKQDVISDLSDIRSGASAGATALQPNDNISELQNDVGYITGITSSDVTTALGYTPYDNSNPQGYTSNVGTVISVNNTSPDNNGNVTLLIPAAQVNSDWNANGGVAEILNKPTLGTMAAENASDYYTSEETNTAIATATNDMATQTWVGEQLDNYTTTSDLQAGYVAKESGKGLSTNDYSNSDKEKVDSLGTMSTESASDYSTKAVADTLYADKSLEQTVETHTSNTDIHVTATDKLNWNAKQEALTAGANVQIQNGVISATDTTYTAGSGIDITNGVISNTQTSAEWGNITGTLNDQTDLKNLLDTKVDKSTLATVATSGDYDDLVNKPVNVSEFTNDANYVTESQLETKQDILVSGTNIKTVNNQSLLGSGNIEIESGSTTAEEIVNANEATGATSPLKVWQGTEQEYSQYELTTWKNWKTDANVSQTSTITVPFNRSSNNNRQGVKLLGGKHVVSDNGFIYYSDDGVNWSSHKINSDYNDYYFLEYHNGIYYAFTAVTGTITRYASTDLVNWTSDTTDSVASSGWYDICFVGNRLIGWNFAGMVASDNDGLNWVNVTLPDGDFSAENRGISYVNGIGFCSSNSYNKSYFDLYVSTDGATWTLASKISGTSNAGSYKIAYGNDMYVMLCSIVESGEIRLCARTSIDGYTWSDVNSLNGGIGNNYDSLDAQSCAITFVNDRFLVAGRYWSSIKCSEDGVNWQDISCESFGRVYGFLPVTTNNTAISYNFNLNSTSPLASPVILVYKKECYTLDSEPTASSVIYSEPSIEAQLTVTTVGAGSITLSDGYTYNRNSGGDTDTYRNVGEVHQDWICNINNVGIKIGNTLIADNTTLDTVPTQGSTNAITSGAVYEVLGNLETALHNFNSRTE